MGGFFLVEFFFVVLGGGGNAGGGELGSVAREGGFEELLPAGFG